VGVVLQRDAPVVIRRTTAEWSPTPGEKSDPPRFNRYQHILLPRECEVVKTESSWQR
jgi:hypothetical protein